METLKFGSIGPIVEFVQNILKILGFYKGNIDGIYGNGTKNAVMNFQKNFGLTSDGIVGPLTWKSLTPYINGALGFIIPTNISYSYSILEINLNSLKTLYPFLEIFSVGKSVLGNNIFVIKIGNGPKEVFYSAGIHANEWITSPLLMKFLADYSYTYKNNLPIFGVSSRDLYNSTTIYIMPMINPDGINLVTGEISPNSSLYLNTSLIANNFPYIPYPSRMESKYKR